MVPNGVEFPTGIGRARAPRWGRSRCWSQSRMWARSSRRPPCLPPTRPDLRFVVFGEGTQRQRAGARGRASSGIAERVAFPGHVDRDDRAAAIAVMVLPSIVENAPMALLEAMAAGVPVVASRAGGIPEITGEDACVARGAGGRIRASPARSGGCSMTPGLTAALRWRRPASRGLRSRYTTDANVEATLRVYEEALASVAAGDEGRSVSAAMDIRRSGEGARRPGDRPCDDGLRGCDHRAAGRLDETGVRGVSSGSLIAQR